MTVHQIFCLKTSVYFIFTKHIASSAYLPYLTLLTTEAKAHPACSAIEEEKKKKKKKKKTLLTHVLIFSENCKQLNLLVHNIFLFHITSSLSVSVTVMVIFFKYTQQTL
jgi:hypothetical protein